MGTKVEVCSPFTAVQTSDVLLIDSVKFQHSIQNAPHARRLVGTYAQEFIAYVEHDCTCRWRTVMCNQERELFPIVGKVFGHGKCSSSRGVGFNKSYFSRRVSEFVANTFLPGETAHITSEPKVEQNFNLRSGSRYRLFNIVFPVTIMVKNF